MTVAELVRRIGRITNGARLRAAAIALLLPVPAAAETVSPIAVEGTEFRVRLADGRTLGSRDLIGAALTLNASGHTLKVRIDAVEPDPFDKSGETLLHSFSVQDGEGRWVALCEPDRDGRRAGFPLAGRALTDGRIVPSPGRIELVCTSGAQGKCVRFGYKPWRTGPGGVSLLDAYNACIKMVRADYCGVGGATTREGMRIDIYDRFGIQKADVLPDMTFEAGWTQDGAVCVNHPRVKENITLDRLAETCPRLRGRLGAACDESAATRLGGLVFNRSSP
jgi:hypothetical protein